MPLPLAHSLAAAAIYKGLDADGRFVAWKRLLLAVVIANLPDLDLIPGILVGEPNRYHHVGFSHSVIFAAVAAVVVGLAAAAVGRSWPTWCNRLSGATGTAMMVGLLVGSHVLLDTLNRDFRAPAGPPIFWPLSNASVQIYPWFVDVAKLSGKGSAFDFVVSVLTVHNLYAMLWELATLGPVVVLVVWWRSRRDNGRRQPGAPPGRRDLDEAA